MELYSYQSVHCKRLLDLLFEYPVVGDISITGSGKTVVGVKLAKHFAAQGYDILIVCLPTLVTQWTECLDKEKIQAEIISIYKLSPKKYHARYFLIVDECHCFKNASTRTDQLDTIMRGAYRTLLISATPFDDLRQF